MRYAEWTITARRAVLRLAQMKYRYFVPECCKQNAIFSGTSQAIKTDHISIIYPQTGDLLSVSCKGTAAAKWQMKFQDNFAHEEGTNSKFSE